MSSDIRTAQMSFARKAQAVPERQLAKMTIWRAV